MIKLFVILPIKFLYYFLDLITPKDDRLVLLACKSGRQRNASLEQLHHALEGHSYYNSYLSSSSNSERCFNPLSIYGFFLSLRARYIYLSHGPGDILYAWFSPRKIVTYVGHGVALKTMFNCNPEAPIKDTILQRLEFSSLAYVIASSKADKEALTKCFSISHEKIIVTGLPRNELVLAPKQGIPTPSSINILYAPTYRPGKPAPFFPFENFDLDQFNKELIKLDIHIYLRGHVNSSSSLSTKTHSNIHLYGSSECEEIQHTLGRFAALITDYSSISIDFLLKNSPILYIPFDYESYQRTRGFLHPYHLLFSGPILNSPEKLLESLKDIASKIDTHKEQREQARAIFHQFDQGMSKNVFRATLEHY
jgi:CDP-glycerol glycerophosphotransferase (TagB/SpsB family)